MKKLLALALALVMVLCAMSALAEGNPSISSSDLENTKTETTTTTETATTTTTVTGNAGTTTAQPVILIVNSEDNDQTTAIKDALMAAGADNALSTLPADVVSKIPAEFKNVNEISTKKVVGDLTNVSSVTATITFATPYTANDTVYLLFGTANGWFVVAGKVDAAGSVVVTLTKDQLDKLGNVPFVIVVVNK